MILSFSLINVVSWILGVVLGLAVLIFLIGFIAFLALTVRRKAPDNGNASAFLMGPHEKELVSFIAENKPLLAALPKERITVETDDNLKLVGYFFECPEKSTKTVICVHGYGSQPWIDHCATAPFYLKNGFNVLLTTNRGHAESEGPYIGFGTLDGYDMKKWTEWVNHRIEGGDIFLHGVSMGAATVLCASHRNVLPCDNIRGVLADCSFTSAHDVIEFQVKRVLHAKLPLILGIADMFCHSSAGYNLNKNTPLDAVKAMDVPVLFIHGKADKFIPVSMGETLYESCTSADKSIVLFEDTGHAGSFCLNGEQYKEAALSFFNRLAAASSENVGA